MSQTHFPFWNPWYHPTKELQTAPKGFSNFLLLTFHDKALSLLLDHLVNISTWFRSLSHFCWQSWSLCPTNSNLCRRTMFCLCFTLPHQTQNYSVGHKKRGSRLIPRGAHFGRRGINLQPCLYGQHSTHPPRNFRKSCLEVMIWDIASILSLFCTFSNFRY